jgi:hypothetical protein
MNEMPYIHRSSTVSASLSSCFTSLTVLQSRPRTALEVGFYAIENHPNMATNMFNQFASRESLQLDNYSSMYQPATLQSSIQAPANDVDMRNTIFDEDLSYSQNLLPNHNDQLHTQTSFSNQTSSVTVTTPTAVPGSKVDVEIWGDAIEDHKDMSWKNGPVLLRQGSSPIRSQISTSALEYPAEGYMDAESQSDVGSPQPFHHMGQHDDSQVMGRTSSTSLSRDRGGNLMNNYIFTNPANALVSRIPVPVEGEPANIHEKSQKSIRIKEGELFKVRRNYRLTKNPDIWRKVYLTFLEYKELMILRGKPERISQWDEVSKIPPFSGMKRSEERDITGNESDLFFQQPSALSPFGNGNVDTSGLTLGSPIFDESYSTDEEYSDTSMSSDDEDSFSLPPLPATGSKGNIPYNKRFDHGQIQAHLTEREMCIIRSGYAPDNLLAVPCFRKPQSSSLINSLSGQRNNPEVADIRRTRVTKAEWTKLQEIRGYPDMVYDDEYKGGISKADRDRGNFHLEQHIERLRKGDKSRNRRGRKEASRMRREKRRGRSSQ